jgi:hypothetical protein
MKLPPTTPKADPITVLVSICPRCRRLIRCAGLMAIRCGGEHGCGATHYRVAEPVDA